MSPNQREGITAKNSISGLNEYVSSTNNKLDVNATASLAGSPIPIAGATTAVGVAIVDGSGNQITSFGGGTQYAELNTASPGTGTLSLGRYKLAAPTLTDGQMYGLQLDSSGSLRVAGTFSPAPASDAVITGTISTPDAVVGAPGGAGATVTGASTAGSLVALSVPGGSSSWMIQTSGTFGGTSVYFEASADSTTGTNGTWISINGRLEGINNTSIAQGVAGAGVVRGTISSFTYIRARAVGGSGLTIAVRIETSSGVGGVFLNASLPTGTNAIGSITNTSFAATQATAANLNATVVGTGTFAVQATLAAETTKVIGTVNQGTSPWVVSNSVLSVVGNGAAATAQRVTLANDSTGVIATVGAVTAITNALPTGTNVLGRVGIDQTTPGTTNRVDIADSLNNPVSAFPATFLRTTDEPHQLFYDPFDTAIDTVNRWTVTSGNSAVAATNTAGVMTMGTGTTANGWSKLASQPSFTPTIPAWLGVSDAIALPDGAAPVSNSYLYWGTGTTPGTPSVATPVTDGYGFERNTDGKLRAVVYAGGTRTVVQDLSTSGNSTQPTDAAYHRYIIYIRTDKAYWYIDGLTSANLVATSNFQSSQVQTLPRLFLTIGNSTPPVSNITLTCTGATAWDTGKNNVQISDGTFPWRKTTVSSSGALSVASTSDIPGTGATNLGKAEDAAHASGDTGVFALAVRNDNLATTYGADQDYAPIAVDLNSRVMVAQKAATATLANVAGSATSVTLIAANSARIGATITNDSSALLYIKFGTTASTTSYTVVLAGAASAPFSYYEVPAGYTGRIDGIWASATGNARTTEIT